MMAEQTTDTICAGGYRLFYREWGDPANPPVILMHGMVVSSRYFRPLGEELAHRFWVLAPDMPGYGNSGKPPYVLSIQETADCLAEFARAKQIDRCDFIGNSAGCEYLTELAIRHPELVRKLVFQGPGAGKPQRRNFARAAAGFVRNGTKEPVRLGFLLLRDYFDAGFVRSIKTMRMLFDYPMEDRVQHVHAPTLLVRGKADGMVSPEWVDFLSRQMPNARQVSVPGAAHTMNYSAPGRLAEVSVPFLRDAA